MAISIVDYKNQRVSEDTERCVTCLRSALTDAKAGEIKQLVVVAVGHDMAVTTYRALSGQDTIMLGALVVASANVNARQPTEQVPETEPDMDE